MSSQKKVRHIVLLKFKKETPQDFPSQFLKNLEGLKQVIPGFLSMTYGAQSSKETFENKNLTATQMTHGFEMLFQDSSARDAYLVHEEHVKLATEAFKFLEDVAIFDYELE